MRMRLRGKAIALIVALHVAGAGPLVAQQRSTSAQKANASVRSTEPAPDAAAELLTAIAELKQMIEAQGRQIERQQEQLREQQRRVESLQAELRRVESGHAAAAAMPAPAPAVAVEVLEGQVEAIAENHSHLAERVSKAEADQAAAQRSTESKLRQLGNFTFSGDIRARYEPFFGGGVVGSPSPASRHRPRFRLRFNANARFSPEWSGGFTVASGEESDPISTNQTLSSFFQRKAVRIDRAFLEYKPNWFKTALRNTGELKVTAGKFGYTWYRTELTLDNDLNPEGLSQTLSFNFKNPVFKNLTVVAFQLPFNEVGSGPDSYMHGAQVQTRWQLGGRARFSSYIGFYDWNHADAIRAAQTAGALTGSSNRNAATASQFASQFGILDVIGRLDLSTWSTRWPLMLQLNYATNTRACANLVNISGTPPACDPSDRDAWWAEVQLGQNREAGDVQFGYTFIRIEREAVLGAFNFSDLRTPSNVLTHRLNLGYQANRNVNLGFATLFGRQLTTAVSPEERFLKRMQIDLIYKF